MRTRFTCLLLFLLLGTCVRAQCPTGLDIRSNEEVTAFLARFPECTDLPGRLTISGATVTDISGLSQLRKVDGPVLIEEVNLRQLEGLQNIQSICGDLTVRDCPNLERVGYELGTALRSVRGAIGLSELPRTSSISWFDNLSILSSGFGSNVVAISNLDELSRLSGSMAYLTLTGNPRLADISGLDNITTIGELTLTGNSALSDCAISPVCASLEFGRPAVISRNTGNCNDEVTVSQACGLLPCTHPDYDALETLYTNTDGDNWTDNTGWLTDCDPCQWFGITCVNGRVTELNLPNNQLDGPLVPELSSLTKLERLHLPDNALTGNFSRLIWGLPLRHVNLSNNQLNTTDDAGDMPLLEFVNLGDNNFVTADLPIITGAPNLRIFNASNAGFLDQVPDTYNPTEMPALQRLDLSGNALFDELPPEFGEFPALISLNLRGNNFVGCYPSGYASLCAGGVTAIFQNNPGLPDGGSLDFFENNFCNNGLGCEPDCHPDYEALAEFYNATDGDNWTTNTGWLTDCEPCNWFGIVCDFSGRVVTISLINNNLSGELPNLFDGLPVLNRLDLPQNNLTGSIPGSLVDLTDLEFLNLQENQLQGGAGGLVQATQLRELNLIGNQFAGAVTSWLPSLINLERVSLNDNQFTGPLPELNNLQSLQLLAVSNNTFRGSLPASLGNLPLLTGLRLENNDFSRCYPASYASFCDDTNVLFLGNPQLPDGGSEDFFQNVFCATGQTCTTCPSNDLITGSQQRLEEFREDYPDCTRFPGRIQVFGPDITSLTPLNNLTFIGGSLSIRRLQVTSLPGITGIDTIMGGFVIDDCPNLGANGFGNDLDLRFIGGVLTAKDLPMVTTTLPIDNLRHIGASLIFRRTGISNMDGLANLEEIGIALTLENNPNLTDLSALDRSGGQNNRAAAPTLSNLRINDNDALVSLDGLAGWMISDNGTISITGNGSLSDCAAETVCDRLTRGNANFITIENNQAGCNTVPEVQAACQALPVEWLAFTATPAGKLVDLRWQTSDETDNVGFAVERSRNGRDWETIGYHQPVAAAVDGTHHYVFTDSAPPTGNLYYRLRQEDADGSRNYGPVRSVLLTSAAVGLYPNPTRDAFTLDTEVAQTVRLHAADGRLLRDFYHPGVPTTTDVSNLATGVYWLRLSATGETLRLVVR